MLICLFFCPCLLCHLGRKCNFSSLIVWMTKMHLLSIYQVKRVWKSTQHMWEGLLCYKVCICADVCSTLINCDVRMGGFCVLSLN